MKIQGMRTYPRRMGTEGVPPLSAAECTTIVRRFGYIAAKMHETVMSRLIADGQHDTAEVFNDTFKPVVDWLLNFDVSRETPRGE